MPEPMKKVFDWIYGGGSVALLFAVVGMVVTVNAHSKRLENLELYGSPGLKEYRAANQKDIRQMERRIELLETAVLQLPAMAADIREIKTKIDLHIAARP